MSNNLENNMDDIDIPDDELFTRPQQDGMVGAITGHLAKVNTSLSEFEQIVAGLNDLHQRFPVDAIYEVTTTKGMEAAKAHRAAWRDPRINVEKIRKMAKSPVIALGKDIDARAAWITEQLLIGEEPIDQLIKAEESRKAKERADKEAKEAGRIIAIQEALGELAMQGMTTGLSSSDIGARLETIKSTELSIDIYQEMLPQAKAAKDAAISKLDVALKAAQWDEEQAAKAAEAARLAEQERAAEIARLEAERAENKRKAEELAQREARLAEAEAKAKESVLSSTKEVAAATLMNSSSPGLQSIPAIDSVDLQRRMLPATQSQQTGKPTTLTLGEINSLLGYTVEAEFLAMLGFVSEFGFYRKSDFPAICNELVAHTANVAKKAKDNE